MDAAIREVQEELHVTPIEPKKVGEVLFQMTDGTAIRIHVYRADDCEGEAEETDEAVPLWTPVDRIPFERMWEDDRLWIPLMLDGRAFEMRTLFHGDTLLAHQLTVAQ